MNGPVTSTQKRTRCRRSDYSITRCHVSGCKSAGPLTYEVAMQSALLFAHGLSRQQPFLRSRTKRPRRHRNLLYSSSGKCSRQSVKPSCWVSAACWHRPSTMLRHERYIFRRPSSFSRAFSGCSRNPSAPSSASLHCMVPSTLELVSVHGAPIAFGWCELMAPLAATSSIYG